MAEEYTEEEVLDAVPDEEVKSTERPEYVPEKFWKDGKADFEGMGKSYTQLEGFVGGKEETLREKIINDLATEHDSNVPESYELPALPDGITEEMVTANPMSTWWNETAKANGMNQEEYESGINAYVEVMQGQEPDIEGEMDKLGENANDRIDAVNAFAEKSFPPDEFEVIQYSLGTTAEGIQALERIMEMSNGSGVRSEQYAQPEKRLTLDDAKSMMADPRYHDPRHRDPAYVAKVDAAFRMLTSGR
tara:strand:+ start:230 stop:973 length:744 start_codon:yes stop_codon:yes gene_type:complete